MKDLIPKMKFICALFAFAMVSIIQVGNAEAYAPYTAQETLSIHQSADSYAEKEDTSNCRIELGQGWSTYICAWKDGDRVSYFYRLAFKVKLRAERYKLKADYDNWYRALTVDSYPERTQSYRNQKLIIQDLTPIYYIIETKRGPPGSEVVLGQYDYNAGGLRVRHRLSERGDVDYYYDGNAVIEEHNASDDSLLAHYRYADRLLSLDTGAATQYYHHDGLGSTVNLTNDTGAIQVSYKLDPWGRIKSQTGTSVNRQIFTGQEHDENTGLIYFGARYYDPDTARFLTQDSYLGVQNTPPSLHRYLYAYSNPTVYVDLYGNWAWTEWLLGSADERLKNADYAIEGLAIESAEAKARGEDYMGWSHRAQAVLFSGYKLGLQTARSAINAADFVIDLGHSQFGLHEEGGFAEQRMLERVEAFDAVASSVISNTKKLAVATVEDPKGTYEALKSLSKEKVPELLKQTQGHLEATYKEGDIKAVAGTSAVFLGLIDPNKKAQGLKRTFKLLGETAEAVTDSSRKLKRVKKVVPKTSKRLPNESGFIREFVQEQDEIYYRVFSGDRNVGSYLTKVPPKTSKWAQEALSLPPNNKAELIQEVVIPAGTKLRRSRAAPMPEWGKYRGGAEQFKLLDRIPTGNFGPGRKLP